MNALPLRQYRDPLEQMLEAETCKGCAHIERWRDEDWCQNPQARRVHATERCDYYEEAV